MRTRSRGAPLDPVDPEIEATARRNNVRRRLAMAHNGGEPQGQANDQLRALLEQVAQMQRVLQEQEAARNAAAPPINQMFAPVLNHGEAPGPRINANNFELKPGLISMVQQNQYGGSKVEDPNGHLQQFLEICSTVKMNGVTDDTIRLRLFPFSLRDAAKLWYQSLEAGAVHSWEDLAHKFLQKFFPPGVTLKLKGEITLFRQFDDEPPYEAWERFREMLRKCPNHGYGIDHQVCIFYNGCNTELRRFLDASAGGSLLNKSPDQAMTIIEDMATNSYQWPGDRQVRILKRTAAVEDTDPIDKLVAKLSTTLTATINERFNALSGSTSNDPPEPVMEDVNYINQNQQRYGGNYRSGNQFYQGNRSNLSYGNPQNAIQPPPGFSVTNGVINEEKKPNMEELLMAFMGKTDKYMGESQARVDKLENIVGAISHQVNAMGTQMKMFEKQLGQLATVVGNQHQPGQFPSNTTVNPKEQCNAIEVVVAPIESLKSTATSSTVEALQQMPGHAKFLKDVISKKQRLIDNAVVDLSESCSAVIQKKLPAKLKDPGSFTIPVTIGATHLDKALCDLGAGVNLMPLSLYQKLKIGELKPTAMCLRMADRSVTYPKGIVEDVLIKVNQSIFPVDFVVLDMEEDKEIPLILGRPFLNTGKALIDVAKGELTLRVNDESTIFSLHNGMRDHDKEEDAQFALLEP